MGVSEALGSEESAAFGGYTREEGVEAICSYVLRKFRKGKMEEIREKIERKREEERENSAESGAKRTKLTPFRNFTETTSLSRCSAAVFAPNVGMVSEFVKRLVDCGSGGNGDGCDRREKKRDVVRKEKNAINNAEYFVGDPGDDFIIALKYDRESGWFEESSNFAADIVIGTTKGLVDLDRHKIAGKKLVIKSEEDLKQTETKIKLETGMYSFLSGVETIFMMDGDILQLQNMNALCETLMILKEARPAATKSMNLKYLSSGNEKKRIFFFCRAVTPEILNIIKEWGTWSVHCKPREGARREGVEATLISNRDEEQRYRMAKHHMEMMSNTCEKLLVVLRDEKQAEKLKEVLKERSLTGNSGVFFIDEHTPRSKIKEECKRNTKKVWVITERFVFYRTKRLDSLLKPFKATKIFSLNVPLFYILRDLIRNTEAAETDEGIQEYRTPLVFLQGKSEEYITQDILGESFSFDEEFQYLDSITKTTVVKKNHGG